MIEYKIAESFTITTSRKRGYSMGKDLKGKELGEGIYQRKDSGRYCGRFTDRFGNRKTVYGDKLQEVKDALVKLQYENNMKLNIIDSDITLNEWYIKWLSIHKYSIIRNTTRAIYENIFNKYISPALGKFELGDITQLQIKGLINDVRKKGLGFETQNKIRILLVDMFGKAQIDDFVRKNPAKGIKLVRDEDEDGGKDIKTLTVDEQQLFFDCCRGTFYDNLFVVAVETGMRMGELCAITEDDIDWDNMVIKVRKTLLYAKLDNDTGKTFHLHPPKTRTSRRDIPIRGACEVALKKQIIQKAVISAKSPKKALPGFENLLFTTKYNTPINSQIYADAIKAIVDEINLTRDPLEEMEYFSSHCFRHTFATRRLEDNMQLITLSEVLGHASLDMTTKLYAAVLPDHLKSEMKKNEASFYTNSTVSDETILERYNQKVAEKSNVVEFKVAK